MNIETAFQINDEVYFITYDLIERVEEFCETCGQRINTEDTEDEYRWVVKGPLIISQINIGINTEVDDIPTIYYSFPMHAAYKESDLFETQEAAEAECLSRNGE